MVVWVGGCRGITKWHTGCNQQPLVTKMLCNKQECSPGVLNHDDRLLLELEALSPSYCSYMYALLICCAIFFFFLLTSITAPQVERKR